MQAALHPRVPARAVDSGGLATTRQRCARESEPTQGWRTATYGTIIVCHSERSEAATQRTKSARPGFRSQFVTRANQRSAAAKCEAEARLLNVSDTEFMSLRKDSDNSATNHFETVPS